MSGRYTPGPWSVNTAGSAKAGEAFKIDEIYVYAPDTQDDTAICGDVIDPVTQKPSEANARLIAAAPDLLEALTMVRDADDDCIRDGLPHHRIPMMARAKIDAALNKATGESS